MFHFCDSKLQQQFILKEEVSISKKEIESLLDSLGEFPKAFYQAEKVSQIPLPKPECETWFTKAEDELFSHCYKDTVKRMNRQILLSFRFQKNKTRVFSIKKFEHYGNQFFPTDVVNKGYRELKHFYKNRFFIAYKCDNFEGNYDIWRENKIKQSPANHSHTHQKRVQWSKYGINLSISYWLMIWLTY